MNPNTDTCRTCGVHCRLAALDCVDCNDRLDLARFAEALTDSPLTRAEAALTAARAKEQKLLKDLCALKDRKASHLQIKRAQSWWSCALTDVSRAEQRVRALRAGQVAA